MKSAAPLTSIFALIISAALLVGCGDSASEKPPVASDPAAGFSQPIAPSPAPPQGPSLESLPPELQAMFKEGQETQTKLLALSEKLSTIQETAMAIEHVVALRTSLEAAAEAAILKENPEAQATLDRLPKLVELLESNEEINNGNPAAFSDETKKMIEEYETLTAQLQPLQAKAAALPEIEAARKKLFDTLHEECLKIDPEFESLEKEYDALNLKLRDMEQAFIQAQQQAQGQAPTPSLPANIATPIPAATPPAAVPNAPTGETGTTEE